MLLLSPVAVAASVVAVAVAGCDDWDGGFGGSLAGCEDEPLVSAGAVVPAAQGACIR